MRRIISRIVPDLRGRDIGPISMERDPPVYLTRRVVAFAS